MQRAILFFSVTVALAGPACAQMRFNPTQTDTNSAMVRIPPSSLPGAGLSGPATSSTKSTYPKPIRREYDPNFIDPTARNRNLRKY